MGDSDSPNNEWIELHNAGGATSLTGWQLTDGNDLVIDLAGTIATGEYAVLERTDDAPAAGDAFLIYTGALPNVGATLTLTRSDGSLADRVAGGENWEAIGGSNETKDTAQYTSSGWVTGVPTPGGTNTTEITAVAEPDETASETSGSSRVARGVSRTVEPLQLPDVTLQLGITSPEMIYVGQPVTFTAEPSGLGKTWLDSLQYDWNLGDLTVDTGQSVTHTYAYPGEYVVTVKAGYARYEQIAKFTVTVLPMRVAIEETADGDYRLRNLSRYEIDLSGHTLYGTQAVIFPERSYLAPQGTVVIPRERVRSTVGVPVTLFDAQDQSVAVYEFETVVSAQPDAVVVRSVPAAPTAPPRETITPTASTQAELDTTPPDFTFAATSTVPSPEPVAAAVSGAPPVSEQAAAVSAATERIPKDAYPYLGLFALLMIGLLAVLAGKRE